MRKDASVLKRYSKSCASFTHGGGLLCHPYERAKQQAKGGCPKEEGMSFPDEEPEGAMTLCQSPVRDHKQTKKERMSR